MVVVVVVFYSGRTRELDGQAGATRRAESVFLALVGITHLGAHDADTGCRPPAEIVPWPAQFLFLCSELHCEGITEYRRRETVGKSGNVISSTEQ